MSLPMPLIHTIESSTPGPYTVIMGGVHGNEPTGAAVFHALREHLQIDTGKVTLILANQGALEAHQRYLETDLNRCFGKYTHPDLYESKLAEAITPYLDQADSLLDIHNTVKNKSGRFLISERPEMGEIFDVDIQVVGLSLDHPGCSDYYMEHAGKPGLTLESGRVGSNLSEHYDFALQSALNYLRYTGNIQQQHTTYPGHTCLNFDRIYYNQEPFTLARTFYDFEPIDQGVLIGHDGDKAIYAEQQGYLLFANHQPQPGSECFLFGTA